MLPALNPAALHALFHDACVQSDQRIVAEKLSVSEALRPENAHRNRYTNVLPWDSTRVIISSANGDYINASHVRNGASHLIATQGPLPSTCQDFFVMLQQHAVRMVVALGPETEMGRAKFHPYWSHESVTINSQRQWEDCAVTERMCSVVAGGQQHDFVHLHAWDWPDHGVPHVRRLL
jgi:protein tyrosine phosphatase